MKLKIEREKIVFEIKRMQKMGLVINTSGNISIKKDDLIAISPSGVSYDNLKSKDIVVLDKNKKIVEGQLLPSSETNLHVSIYDKYNEVSAIVHTHSLYATSVSTLLQELPAIHYQIADLGGPIKVAPYETFGTEALAIAVAKNLKGRKAVLMKNHGAVTVGGDIYKSASRAILLEWLCSLYLLSKNSGNPTIIDDNEIKNVMHQMSKFKKLRSSFLN
tara:strand:+ start:5464 stop:6117 length:654 start_codon:yes stop_codon:yes gene_type:complete